MQVLYGDSLSRDQVAKFPHTIRLSSSYCCWVVVTCQGLDVA